MFIPSYIVLGKILYLFLKMIVSLPKELLEVIINNLQYEDVISLLKCSYKL